MTDIRRWEMAADSAAVEDRLSSEELAFVERFDDEEAEIERAFFRDLAELGRVRALPTHDRDVEQAREWFGQHRRARVRRKAWFAGVGSMAAAALLVVGLSLPVFRSGEVAQVVPASAVVTQGGLMFDEAVLDPGAELPVERWVVARDEACVRARAGTACVDRSTRLRLRDSGGLEVDEGVMRYEGTGEVTTALGTLESTEATLTIERAGDRLAVEVHTGSVIMRDLSGDSMTLSAGESHTWGSKLAHADGPARGEADDAEDVLIIEDDEPSSSRRTRRPSEPAVVASAGDLLAEARALLAQGADAKALAVYEKLRRIHASSSEAHIADVSIGEIQLRKGKASAALAAFDRYLDRGGSLKEEALWGRIRALHRLGRISQRDAAVEQLRAKFPKSVYLGRLPQ